MICRYPDKECSRKNFDKESNLFICESHESFCKFDSIDILLKKNVIKESEYQHKKCLGQTELI